MKYFATLKAVRSPRAAFLSGLGPIVLLASGAFLTACATNEQVFKLEERIRRIEIDSRAKDSAYSRLDSLYRSSQAGKSVDVAKLQNRLTSMEDEIERLRNTVNDLETRLNKFSRGTPVVVAPAERNEPREPESGVNCVKLFDDSFIQFRQAQYDAANAGFRDYLKYCGGHENADNAQYWIAEGFYTQRKYADAQREYEALMTRYAESDKVPTAIYKLGRCSEESGDKASAKKRYQQVVDRFPSSSEAQLATDKLKELK